MKNDLWQNVKACCRDDLPKSFEKKDKKRFAGIRTLSWEKIFINAFNTQGEAKLSLNSRFGHLCHFESSVIHITSWLVNWLEVNCLSLVSFQVQMRSQISEVWYLVDDCKKKDKSMTEKLLFCHYKKTSKSENTFLNKNKLGKTDQIVLSFFELSF